MTEPAFSKGSSQPTAAGRNSDPFVSNSSITGMVVPELVSSQGCDLPPGASDDDLGNNNSLSLTEVVVCPVDVPPSSHGCSPPPGVGDNSALGNSRESITEFVLSSTNVLASSKGSSLLQDVSSPKLAKVEDIPQKLVSEHNNNTQKRARMPAIILEKLQKPRKLLRKNVLAEEPQTCELQGSGFKAWSQEEKDVFAEKLTSFGMDFAKVSSFLRHKTTEDCIEYYSEYYKSECSKKDQNNCLPTVKQSQEQCSGENDAAPFMSGIATATATKNHTRLITVSEDIKKPVNQLCLESTAQLRSHSLPDKENHCESSMNENENERGTGKDLVGEMNVVPSPLGMSSPTTNSSQDIQLSISKTEVSELKNLNEDSYFNEKISKGEQEIWTEKEQCHIIQGIEKHYKDSETMETDSEDKVRSKDKNHVHCVASIEHSGIHLTSNVNSREKEKVNIDQCPQRSDLNAYMENYRSHNSPSIVTGVAVLRENEFVLELKDSEAMETDSKDNDDMVKSMEKNRLLCVVSNVDSQEREKSIDTIPYPQGTDLNTDMQNTTGNSSPCIVTDAAELTSNYEFVESLMVSEAIETESEDNEDRVKSKEGNHGLCVVSKRCNAIQFSSNVNSQKEKEKVDIIPSLGGNDLNADIENPRRNNSPCNTTTDAGMLRGKAFVQMLIDSEEMDTGLSCNVTSQKEKGKIDITPSPVVNDHNAPPNQISDEAPKTFHSSSSSGSAFLDLEAVYENSSRVQMDIDLNIPLDVNPVEMDVGRAEASMGLREPRQITDSAAMEHESGIRVREPIERGANSETAANDVTIVHEIRQSQTTASQIAHQPANQLGGIMLFGQVIYQAPSSGTSLTPNHQGNQVFVRSSDMPSNSVVPVRPSGGQQVYPSWLSNSRSVPVNLGQQAVMSNRMPYRPTNASAGLPLPFQPGSSSTAFVNMSQQRQPVVNMMMPYNMMIGGVVPSYLMPGSSSGGGFVNFIGFNPGQQQWPRGPTYILDRSRMMIGYPGYLPDSTQNQAPTGIVMPSAGINRDGASTSNTRPPAAGRGRARNPSLPFYRSTNQQ